MVMLQKSPNKQKMTMTFQGKDIVQPSFDGNEGWNTNFMTMKPEKMEAEDSEIMKQDTDFPDAFWNFKDKGYSIALEGEESVEGVACHKIKLTKKPVKVDGKEEENFSYYFFIDSFLSWSTTSFKILLRLHPGTLYRKTSNNRKEENTNDKS